MPGKVPHDPAEATVEISVALVNKPGRLAGICRVLAKEKIHILALTVSDSARRGLLRMIVSPTDKAVEALKRTGAEPKTEEVLTVILPNKSAALADAVEQLAQAHINIDYAYCSTGARGGKTLGVLSVKDVARALKVLRPKQHQHKDRPQGRSPAR